MRLRRRTGFGALVALGLVLAACAAPGADPTPQNSAGVEQGPAETNPQPGTEPSPAEPSPAAPSSDAPSPSAATCRTMVDDLTARQRAGLLFMVAITNDTTPSADTLRVIADLEVGNVLLLGNTEAGVEQVRAFTDEIREVVGDDVLIAVDQEGGLVQRLQGPGFDRIPDAVDQAVAADLAGDAERWGEQLREAGVDANLAPVADVVPADRVRSNAPIGQLRRGYGSEPEQVGRAVTDFIDGMSNAEVATAVKHYPGLGRVAGNPDFAERVVDEETTRDDPGLAPFGAAVDADVSMVMVSSATYARIDPQNQGVFSSIILQEMIRGDLGFDGVIISDDLGAAQNLASVPVADRGWQFIAAGGDLVINADPAKAAAMSQQVIERAERDPAFAEQVAVSATRVMELKDDLGLVDCG